MYKNDITNALIFLAMSMTFKKTPKKPFDFNGIICGYVCIVAFLINAYISILAKYVANRFFSGKTNITKNKEFK